MYVCVDVLCECVYGVCGDCGTPVIFFNYFSSLSFSYPRYTQGTEATHRCDACKYDLCAACVAWAQGCVTPGVVVPLHPHPLVHGPCGYASGRWVCDRCAKEVRMERKRESVCERERDKERERVCVCERG